MPAVHRARIAPVLLAGFLLVLMSGCASSQTVETVRAEPTERLRVSGSGTALPLLHILTDAYAAENVEFVYLPELHSGGGCEGVAGGDLDIGTASLELAGDERAVDLETVKISDDGLVLAVHPSVTIDGLTSEQVREIYRGEHENWSELGGPDIGIVILDRNEEESAKIILREYVLGPDLEITEEAVNLFYELDMIEGVQSTGGAIGYFSLGYGLCEKLPVRFLSLDGIEPSVETIMNGEYKMVRPLSVVARRPVEGPVKDFLDWVQSDEATDLITEAGFARPLDSPAQ